MKHQTIYHFNMQWLVCRDKQTETLFIETRERRNQMISVFLDAGFEITSNVIKVFETEQEAKDYLEQIGNVDDLIDNL